MIARRMARDINSRTAREINWSARRRLMMDSLGMVRKVVDKEIPSNQAEAITSVITDTMENMFNTFVSKEQMKMSEIIQNANFSTFKFEIKSLQENNFSFLQHELEKTRGELQRDIEMSRCEMKMDNEKMHNELKVEHSELKMDVAKVFSELKLNIEKMRLNHDVAWHDRQAQIESRKYDFLKYLIGGLISLSALSFTAIKLLK